MGNTQTTFKIIDSVFKDQKYIIVAQLISGEIEINSIFISNDTGLKFIVKGIGFIPHESHAKGKRAIVIKPYNDNFGDEIKIDDIFYSCSEV
jgi:hypothetical protein